MMKKEINPIQKAMNAFMVLTPEQMNEFLDHAKLYADVQKGIDKDQKLRRESQPEQHHE